MSTPADPTPTRLRRSIYWIFVAAAAGIMIGRILAVDSIDVRGLEKVRAAEGEKDLKEKRQAWEKEGLPAEEIEAKTAERKEALMKRASLRRPFLSSNDRSRWCTVRALVEDDMRVEGFPYAIDKVVQEQGWDTIDMVKHDGYGRGGLSATEGHLYSSKPPLYPTLLAAQYWVIHKLTGETLGTQPYAIGRTLLILNNVLPLVLYFWILAKLLERFGTSDWGRMFVMGAAAFGTFLTTFAVVINNHLPAAVCVIVALYAAVRIWFDDRRGWHYFALAGFFGAFAVADELPALSFFAALAAALLWKAPWKTIAVFAPAALIVAAGHFGTNWIAHHTLKPAYAHRSETNPADNWYSFDYMRGTREIPSYWKNPSGVDRGEPSAAKYALHVLVGHHGVFSLTPVWLLSVVGAGVWLFGRPEDRRLRELALLILAVSSVVLAFYLMRPPIDRNYGGMSSGLRWVFWLAPMWLVAMLPAADAASRRGWTRGLSLVLLVVSALSASYPTWNPWTQPWFYDFMVYLGWISG